MSQYSSQYSDHLTRVLLVYSILYFTLSAGALLSLIRGIYQGAFLINGPFSDVRSAYITSNYGIICLTSILKGLLLCLYLESLILPLPLFLLMCLICFLSLQLYPLLHHGSYFALLMFPDKCVKLATKSHGNPFKTWFILFPYIFINTGLLGLSVGIITKLCLSSHDSSELLLVIRERTFLVFITQVSFILLIILFLLMAGIAYTIKTITWWKKGTYSTNKTIKQATFTGICVLAIVECLVAISIGIDARIADSLSSQYYGLLVTFFTLDLIAVALLAVIIWKTPEKLKHRRSVLGREEARKKLAAENHKVQLETKKTGVDAEDG